jgi:GNAT superfamily N-acetyltransferase
MITGMQTFIIKPLSVEEIDAVAEMEYDAWHSYYRQYAIYDLIAESVTLEGIKEEWQNFISTDKETKGPLISGEDRKAYIAVSAQGEILGIGAASSYKEKTWPEVDKLLRKNDGTLKKTTKFQNLYINQNHRGSGIGHYLSIARADYMLDLGYEACFLTTYLDATKTIEYHKKNGMQLVHQYESIQTYGNNQKVLIACFLNDDLQALREFWQEYIDRKISNNVGYKLLNIER